MEGDVPTYQCKTCSQHKIKEDYYAHKETALGIMGTCKACTKEEKPKNPERTHILVRVQACLQRSKERKRVKGRSVKGTCEFAPRGAEKKLNNFFGKARQQRFKCQISNRLLRLGGWSIERVVESIDYTMGNTVLIEYIFQSGQYGGQDYGDHNPSQWSAVKFKYVLQQRRTYFEPSQSFLDILEAKEQGMDDTHPIMRSFTMMKGHAAARTRAHNNKFPDNQWVFGIESPNLLSDLFIAQRGLCAYLQVPLAIESGSWHMSLERVNDSGGYTLNNCVLICGEVNLNTYSRRKWSRELATEVFGPAHDTRTSN